MTDAFARTRLLLGTEAMEKLARSRVAVFGLGGVGGHVCEALARSGVGALDLIDADRVALTNLNRQIIATRDTIGRLKTEVMQERILQINPDAEVRTDSRFVLPENIESFPFAEYDYVVDAVDTVAAKLALIQEAKKTETPIISAMGAGNKLDGSRFRVADISETSICPLARVMRRELRRRGIEKLKVVYSDEPPVHPMQDPTEVSITGQEQTEADPTEGEPDENCLTTDGSTGMGALEDDSARCGKRPEPKRREIPGSTAFVPAVAGLLIAGEVIRDLCTKK